VCPEHCHTVDGGVHEIQWKSCTACGACVDACPGSALEIKGKSIGANRLVERIKKDKDFFDASGGGLTLSGGEPLSQFDFSHQVLLLARENGIHTCIETSGFAPLERILRIGDVTDIFLYDFKESDPQRHLQWTGVDNARIIRNLFVLDKAGARTILRCPIVPGVNDRMEHLHAIAELAESLVNVLEIQVMPYHPMGSSKSGRIGREYPLENMGFPGASEIETWLDSIRQRTKVPARKG
jgi:pyruvate formate lyase activating enzyme